MKNMLSCLNAGKNINFQKPQAGKKQKLNRQKHWAERSNWISLETYTIENYPPRRIY